MAQRSSIDDRAARTPRVESLLHRPSAPRAETPPGPRQDAHAERLANRGALQHTPKGTKISHDAPATKPGHQRFVLSDPVAFRYLEEDPTTTVFSRRTELSGYEVYVVEQWATSRTHPTYVITTYTGDPSHTVIVGVLSVPTDETTWSPRLRVYFKALNQYHARRRETPLGILMVTNLSGFPSGLTVIPVPDGDTSKHRLDFTVNENLKRFGCSGRVGLQLTAPTGATKAKFHQLYRTSNKIDIYKSVIELVKLCQSALMLFDKLAIDYADGLLCDITERAINDWWVEIGSEQYNVEPHDGILGPTTVAGLLGLLMGARNRLHAVNAPVAKDAFDVEAMKRGISHFQKQHRLARTRRLDRPTLIKLQKATQKAADHEGWSMPKVLKTTAAELSGKGGEMVMDAVGRRDRAGIAEIETCDIERFVQLVYGERPRWLWQGKPPKKANRPLISGPQLERETGLNQGLVFKPDEHGGFTWTAKKSTQDGLPSTANSKNSMDLTSPPPTSAYEDAETEDEEGRFGLFKREAKSGLGKFRGAVGLKGHQQQKSSVDESPTTPVEETAAKMPLFRRTHSSPATSPEVSKPSSARQTSEQRQNGSFSERAAAKVDVAVIAEQAAMKASLEQQRTESRPHTQGHDRRSSKESLAPPSYRSGSSVKSQREWDQTSTVSEAVTREPSIAGSVYKGVDLNEVLPTGPETGKDVPLALRRTLSLSRFVNVQLEHRADDAYPRHLSFSLAEDSVLTWRDLTEEDSSAENYPSYSRSDPAADLASQNLLARQAEHAHSALTQLTASVAPWTEHQLQTLQGLLEKADSDEQLLYNSHSASLERASYLQTHAEGVLREQREILDEGGKETETLAAKLEYECGVLRGRVEDVEAGVSDYEESVRRVEERVEELEREGDHGKGSWGCVVS